ncbi:MAG: DUF5320 domain-containing protein [Candidatus Thermoplasmatota archaeon]|nr:DUF5320 domain-containing protein [Candidatus Thermoplasmatota archaeon]
MPGGDGTGPWGRGPRTGWGLGYCGDPYGPMYPGPRGRGFGRGRRWFYEDIPERNPIRSPVDQSYFKEPSREKEKNYLQGIVQDMEAELLDIKERIAELDKEKDE